MNTRSLLLGLLRSSSSRVALSRKVSRPESVVGSIFCARSNRCAPARNSPVSRTAGSGLVRRNSMTWSTMVAAWAVLTFSAATRSVVERTAAERCSAARPTSSGSRPRLPTRPRTSISGSTAVSTFVASCCGLGSQTQNVTPSRLGREIFDDVCEAFKVPERR